MNEFEGGRNSSGLEGRSEDIHVRTRERESHFHRRYIVV